MPTEPKPHINSRFLMLVLAATVIGFPFLSALASPSIWWSGVQDIWIPWSGQMNFLLDIDSDGNDDLKIYYSNTSLEVIASETLGNTEVIWKGEAILDLASGQSVDVDLPAGQSWSSGSDVLAEYNSLVSGPTVGAGPWAGVEHGYMGVQFHNGADTYYGWVDLSVSDGTPEAYIHSWAYNTTPGASLPAGQVPEPSTIALFLVGATAFVIRHRA